jgi:hypothetical protein
LLFFVFRRKDNDARKNVIRPRKLWKKENGRWKRSDRQKWRYFKKSDDREKNESIENTKKRRRNDWSWLERSSGIGRSECLLCRQPTRPRSRSCNEKFNRNRRNRPDVTKKTLNRFVKKPWNYPSCVSHRPEVPMTHLVWSTMKQHVFAASVTSRFTAK